MVKNPPLVFYTDYDDGVATIREKGWSVFDPSPLPDDIFLLALPCPGARISRGGVGGQTMTSCSFCGEMMPSSAGPHSKSGRYFQPVIVTASDEEYIQWRHLHMDDVSF